MMEKKNSGSILVAVQSAFSSFPLSGDPAKIIRLTLHVEVGESRVHVLVLYYCYIRTYEIKQHESLIHT